MILLFVIGFELHEVGFEEPVFFELRQTHDPHNETSGYCRLLFRGGVVDD